MALSAPWTDAEAVARTPALVQRGGEDFLLLARRLSRAAEALEAALAAEERSEEEDQRAEESALRAQATLLRALRPRVESAEGAAGRARVARLLEGWTDPYAADATGRPLLDAARAMTRPKATGPEGLREALDAMRAAGGRRDRAAERRAQAIRARVAARQVWDRAHDELRAAAGWPEDGGRPPEVDLSAWFREPSEE